VLARLMSVCWALVFAVVAVAPIQAAAGAEPTTWTVDRLAGTATLVVLGDSISAVPSPYCGWPNCWPQRVAFEWPTTNLSRSGAQPGDLLPGGWCYRECWSDWGEQVIAQIGQLQPSAVALAIGAVPYGWIGQAPVDYLTNMRAVADRIRAVSPRSTILLVHTPGFRASHGLTWIWVDYGTGLDAYAATQPNMGYYDAARDLPWADSDTAGMFAPDATHPNNAGQVGIAVGVISRLRWL
jgi:hypothetical protein